MPPHCGDDHKSARIAGLFQLQRAREEAPTRQAMQETEFDGIALKNHRRSHSILG
jgi:hypothetical protein